MPKRSLRYVALTLLALTVSACSSGNRSADPIAIDTFAENSSTLSASSADFTAYLSDRAAYHSVPDISVTLSANRIAPVTVGNRDKPSNDVFQAASLSKAVAAAGILIVMKREGIDIDADIRDRFISLNIAELDGGDRPLTVRELLSHTAGANQSGYPGYRRNKYVPSPLEVITDPPHPFVSSVKLVGEKGQFSYSGGGYMIAQILAEDLTGQPFAALMQSVLLEPLGMTRSTFSQPIDANSEIGAQIVPAHSGRRIREGLFRPLKSDWLTYPEQAAAGLWTTSADYADFIDALLRAYSGQDSPIPQSVAQAMLTPVDSNYGLGVMIESHDSQPDQFWHSGLNAGYRALFSASLEDGRYIVSLSNSPGGAALNREVIDGFMSAPLSASPAVPPNGPSDP